MRRTNALNQEGSDEAVNSGRRGRTLFVCPRYGSQNWLL